MKKKLLKRIIAVSLAVTMTASMTAVTQSVGTMSLTASAATSWDVIDSGQCGETATYTLNGIGELTISGSGAVYESAFASGSYAYADSVISVVFAEGSTITDLCANSFSGLTNLQTVTIADTVVSIAGGSFSNCGALTSVSVASTFVKLHPDAFSGSTAIQTLAFTALDGTTIQGELYGLAETAQVIMQPFSKIYKPAGKSFTGSSAASDYQSQYDHAVLYWEDTDSIVEAAAADEAGVRISDTKESLAWITNDNMGTYFTDAQCSINGTMEGDGSFENPYLIYTPQNWRYLDYLGRLSKLSSSYYGWDRGTNVKLMADLTLSDKDGTFTTLGGGKHKEVHNSGYNYTGNFDGNGHTITLDVNESIDDDQIGFGLFDSIGGAYIKNLHISGRMVSSQQYTGLLVGYAQDHDRIFNCSSDAVLVLEGSGEMKSGTLVGYSYRSYIENCHFTGKILGGDEITAVGGFVGELSSSNGGSTMKNCYFAPSEIDVESAGSCILYRPYYGSYSGWRGFAEIENNYYNAEALKLSGADMGDLDQGTSDSEGIDSLNETEFWEDGQLTMPQATVAANPGTTRFAYSGSDLRIIMPLQGDSYTYGGDVEKGGNFPHMPGYGRGGSVYYKVNDGDWSLTAPSAKETGEYTVYYRAAGDAYHRDSDIQSIKVTIEDMQELPGSGTPADPYTISNDYEWSILCSQPSEATKDKYYKLTKDIVVSQTRLYNNAFMGEFDGDGHKITFYFVGKESSFSPFGALEGHSDYYSSEAGNWHYKSAVVKNLTVDGVFASNYGAIAGIATSGSHGVTISNVINNMKMTSLGVGGMDCAGIANISISGGAHLYNCKVSGTFEGTRTTGWRGMCFMNDFWNSTWQGVNVTNCYFVPSFINVKVDSSNPNFVIMGNYKEDKMTIENSFFGGAALDMIPVDEETGETTNTQGISDENGLDDLYATGYWADGNPTMPQAVITKKAPSKTSFVYEETEATVIDEETGEEVQAMVPVEYSLADGIEADGGTIWYQVNGGEWTTEVPEASAIGKYTVKYKAVGDYLHRDSDTQTAVADIVYSWAQPANVSVDADNIPYEKLGELTSGNAAVTVSWDDRMCVDRCAFSASIVTPDGTKGIIDSTVTADRSDWTTENERNSFVFEIPVLGEDDQQVFADNTVNGAKYGDSVIISVTGMVYDNGSWLESLPGKAVDFTAAKGSVSKSFPVLPDGMSNDSELQESEIVKGDNAVVECIASGGKAPYKFEVKYKKEASSSYIKAQSYSKNQIVSFVPAAATVYDIHVDAKDAEGNVTGKDFKLTVNKVLENNSVISENEIVSGETAIISASAVNGLKPYKFEVSYKASGDDSYTTVQEYDTNNKIDLTLPQNEYKVLVNVRDARGKVAGKEFDLKVNKPLENNSQLSEDQIVIGNPVQVSANAEGGLAPYQYEISCKNAGSDKYTTLQEYGSNSSISLTPDAVGTCQIHVNIKDARGTVVGKDLTVRVNELLTNVSEISESEIVLGETLNVTAGAEGGIAPYQFEITYNRVSSSRSYTAQSYGSGQNVDIKPIVNGNWVVHINVKDAKGTVVSKDINFKVNKVLSNVSEISENEIVLGEYVNVTAAAEGGMAPYEFEVTYKRAGGSKIYTAQSYKSNQSVRIKPSSASEIIIYVNAKDARGTVVSKEFTLTVNNTLENLSELDQQEIVTGDTIVISENASGGLKPYQYEAAYKLSGEASYTVVQEYSDGNNKELTFDEEGTYSIRVNVRDARGTVESKEFSLTVNRSVENHSQLSEEEIVIGDSLQVIAKAEEGLAPYQYEISCKNAGSDRYTTLQEYGSNSSMTITPDAVGTCQIHVNIKDARGTVVGKDLTVKVNKLLENVSGISENEIVLGETINVTASAEGGMAPYQFEVTYKRTSGSKIYNAQSYKSEQNVRIKPASASDLIITVNAKDARGTVVSKEFNVKVNKVLSNVSEIAEEEIVLGEYVNFKAAAEGGMAPYQFEVTYKKAVSANYITAQEYSSNQEVKFKPVMATTYDVRINAKDARGTVVSKEFTVKVNKALENLSETDQQQIVTGDTITVSENASGGLKPYQYEAAYKLSEAASYIVVQDYSDAAETKITPDAEGIYSVRVNVKDARGTVESKEFTLTVNKLLSNTSSVSDNVIVTGDAATISASSEGGIAPYSYEIAYSYSDGEYTVLQEYSDNESFMFVPEAVGNYTVRVNAKDSRGTVVSREMDLQVNKLLENLSDISDEEIVLGDYVTASADAEGGVAPYKYKFEYRLGTDGYTTVQDYASNRTVNIELPENGQYGIRISVKDSRGNVSDKEFELTVSKAIENTSAISAERVVSGSTVTVNVSSQYGIGSCKYAVFYKSKTEATWKKAQGYKSNTKVNIKFYEEGEYDICTKALDSFGNAASKYFVVTVISGEPLNNTSTLSAESIKAGETLTVNCSSKGGAGDVQYAVYYKKASESKWIVAQSYSSNDTVTLNLDSEGTYNICIKAKDSSGTIEKLYTDVISATA